jgi:hypothetical protein
MKDTTKVNNMHMANNIIMTCDKKNINYYGPNSWSVVHLVQPNKSIGQWAPTILIMVTPQS